MKKLFTIMLVAMATMVLAPISVNAQIMRAEDLEDYTKEKFGENWVDAAANLGSQLELDKNNALTYVQIIEAPGKTKEQLYVILNYWVSASFNDANSVIKLNDKELGTIIAEGCVRNIAFHMGGTSSYAVSIRPMVKCDIKDGKVRVTYTVPFYDVVQEIGGGWTGMIASSRTKTIPTRSDEKWLIDQCFPFAQKDKHKKTSSKALVMTHACSMAIMDKIEEAIKNGVSGNETEDW